MGSFFLLAISKKSSPVLARVSQNTPPISISFFNKKAGKTILFPKSFALVQLLEVWLLMHHVIYSAVRKAGVTTAATVAGAGPLNLGIGLINLCFIKGSCRIKSVQLGWYPPRTINDADTFGPSPLRNSKSDLKASGGYDSANFQLRGGLNASASIHISSHPDTWAHCLGLLMQTLEVCSPPPLLLLFYPV